MQNSTDADLSEYQTVRQAAAANRNVFTSEPGLRWLIFQHADELEAEGALIRLGRKVLIHPKRTVAVISRRSRKAA